MFLIITLSALLISAVMFIPALRFAINHNIVDNPNARKLQRRPVPVFGGIVVLSGIIIPTLVAIQFFEIANVWYVIGAIICLWVVGVTDDIRGLSASARFILEIILVWILILHPLFPHNGPMIDHLHGLFGRGGVSLYSAVPLTIVSAVGLINAINLIDGIDGYSSGYGIVSHILFAILFHIVGNNGMCVLNAIVAAALIPFYIHNVFGRKSKMFLGDGGSLIIGFLIANNVLTLLSSESNTVQWEHQGVGLIALALAVTCIPVFDTLRVMMTRIFNGRSPFSPDKGHLHHAFIELGFSHFATSSLIILMNLLIVALWYLSYLIGASVTWQFWWVVILGISATFGVYHTFRFAEEHKNQLWRELIRIGQRTRVDDGPFGKKIESIVDTGSPQCNDRLC